MQLHRAALELHDAAPLPITAVGLTRGHTAQWKRGQPRGTSSEACAPRKPNPNRPPCIRVKKPAFAIHPNLPSTPNWTPPSLDTQELLLRPCFPSPLMLCLKCPSF
ncbi:uncharacterized protein VTP21DRAFT_3242 [Calcarisporiella thermophila]|uniref:uncharacterized protein n=1 Tax=Calcarisporiella thermophila TaxID=911321 RepID=UPI003742F220